MHYPYWDTLHVHEVKSNVPLISPFWDNPALGSACPAPLLPAAHAQDPPFPDYARFLALLRQARKDAGMVQQDLADRLGKPQSFVAKVERGERRIDVIEFIAIAKAIGRDPMKLLKQHLAQESSPTSRSARWR